MNSDVAGVLKDALPETIGGLSAVALVSLAGYIWKRRRQAKKSSFAYHKELLAADDAAKFQEAEACVSTEDDSASLALIAAIVDKYAVSDIKVVGRGSQRVDVNTPAYMRAVVRTILRGVSYCRILILDQELPSNGIAWLMLLERFVSQAKFRGKIALYTIQISQSKGITAQFQIVDDRFLHRTYRFYHKEALGVDQTASSFFAVAPHPEVANHLAAFRQQLQGLSPPLSHAGIVRHVQELLLCFDEKKSSIRFHWKMVLDTIDFLERLDVEGMPPKSVRFIGALMPFTFTFEAAKLFQEGSGRDADSPPVVVLPFENLDDCITEFRNGRLDYLCLPSENTIIGDVAPPSVSPETVQKLYAEYAQVFSCDIKVAFCLAGQPKAISEVKHLVAVGAAFNQVETILSKRILSLPRKIDGVHSNYHAAWLATNENRALAITTTAAAAALGLTIYKTLEPTDKNETHFKVLGQRAR